MKLPGNEPAKEEGLPGREDAYIMNPVMGERLLTSHQALNAINVLSAILLADGSIRRHTENKE
jgi:hypothetical protein